MTTTVTAPAPGGGPPAQRPRRRRWAVIAAVLLVLVAGMGARAAGWGRPADVRAGTASVDVEGMEARWGIHVELIAVIAAGGLIELRYHVVDPDKADPILHDVKLLPKLVVEDTGATLSLSSLPHNHSVTLELGGTYFFLMANARSAVQDGSLVTLIIGDVRLEHIRVEG